MSKLNNQHLDILYKIILTKHNCLLICHKYQIDCSEFDIHNNLKIMMKEFNNIKDKYEKGSSKANITDIKNHKDSLQALSEVELKLKYIEELKKMKDNCIK